MNWRLTAGKGGQSITLPHQRVTPSRRGDEPDLGRLPGRQLITVSNQPRGGRGPNYPLGSTTTVTSGVRPDATLIATL